MEPNLQKSDDDACGNRSHPPPLRDSGYDGGRELSGEGGEPSPPPRGGGASDGFTDLFYGRGIGNTNPQHRQKLLTFNTRREASKIVRWGCFWPTSAASATRWWIENSISPCAG